MKIKPPLMIIIYILNLLFISCSQQNNDNFIEKNPWNENNNTYKEYKKFFPKNLVNHFPDGLSKNSISFYENFDISNLDFRPPQDYAFMVVDKTTDSSEINLFSKMNIIEKFNSTDSNHILIFSYNEDKNVDYDNISITGKTNEESRVLANRNLLFSKELPIPYFSYVLGSMTNTYSGLDSSFIIQTIDAKAGIYIDTTHMKCNDYLPKKWKHGYSKGVAISEKKQIIIYWVVVW